MHEGMSSEDWFEAADDAADRGYLHVADMYWELGVREADREADRKLMKKVHYGLSG
jgi:hypothetical protein